MELESLGTGECVTVLRVELRHFQQNGVVHAGVQAMADHTAGAAAFTVAGPGQAGHDGGIQDQPAACGTRRSPAVSCAMLKPGRQLVFVESDVWSGVAAEEHLVSKASATMSVLAAT